MRSWTRHGELWVVRLLRFFYTSLRCQDMTEDDLSFYRVRIWIWHGKLGRVSFLQKNVLECSGQPFHFLKSVLELGMVNQGGYAFYCFLI